MGYILKNTAALINVRFTDTGRKKLSQGNLNVSLFQIGDSEMSYNCYTTLPTNSAGIEILQPEFNAQNSSNLSTAGILTNQLQNFTTVSNELNKANVKYPIPVGVSTGITYGVATPDPGETEVFNVASPRGFFTGGTLAAGQECCDDSAPQSTGMSALTNSAYTLSSNWYMPVSAMNGTIMATLVSGGTDVCAGTVDSNLRDYFPHVNDYIGIRFSNHTASTVTPHAQFTLVSNNGSTITACPPVSSAPCTAATPFLFYKITGNTSTSGVTITRGLDRPLPDFSMYKVLGNNVKFAQVFVFPGKKRFGKEQGMLNYYGMDTPTPYWSPGSLSFENNCDISVKDVKIWNMNIPWTENPAGLDTASFDDMSSYGSTGFTSTKEYLGYSYTTNSNWNTYYSLNPPYPTVGSTDTGSVTDYYGQLTANGVNNFGSNLDDVSGTYIFDSFGKIRTVLPQDQKTIAILHYTNETISNFYGEKFATKPNGANEPINGVGEARNFKINFPWLMWHKKFAGTAPEKGSGSGTGVGDEKMVGQCFFTDPDPVTFTNTSSKYIQSTKNPDMNNPGIRYFNLWDNNFRNQGSDGALSPSRVGKVFPDLKIIVVDDEELVAALSYKSNRSWTLPMPKVEMIPAGDSGGCDGSTTVDPFGILNQGQGDTDLHLTYVMESSSGYTTGLHCNYYNKIQYDSSTTPNQDLQIVFGKEFPYLHPYAYNAVGDNTSNNNGLGFQADSMCFLVQKTTPGVRPTPNNWTKICATNQISGLTMNNATFGNDQQSGITATQMINTTFRLNNTLFTGGTTYNLTNLTVSTGATTSGPLNLPVVNAWNDPFQKNNLQFGDEYFMYGNLNTDITATIYEMKFQLSLNENQFNSSTNPSWTPTDDVKITEIGLYDQDKDLLAVGKLKRPVKRDGSQVFTVKVDF